MVRCFQDQLGGTITDGVVDLPNGTPNEVQLEEFGQFVVDYNQTQIEDNLKMAWEAFGKVCEIKSYSDPILPMFQLTS